MPPGWFVRRLRQAAACACALLLLACAVPAPPVAAPRQRLVLSEGPARIDVIVEGRGPAVVLLPSSQRDSEDFDEVAARIAAAGFKVLRPQPRGMGASTGPMQGLSLHVLAADVAATIAPGNANEGSTKVAPSGSSATIGQQVPESD